MKVYVIYRKLTETEIENKLYSSEYVNMSRDELKEEVYAFTISKKIAKEFMRIHSDEYFRMKKHKYNDEEYFNFLEDCREKSLSSVELKDISHKIYVPMTEDEETEIDTIYYDEVISALPGIIETIPSCLIFRKKYRRVLDLLSISKSVYKARIYNTSDDETAAYDMEIDGCDCGECGYESCGLSQNSINLYVSIFSKWLKERKAK